MRFPLPYRNHSRALALGLLLAFAGAASASAMDGAAAQQDVGTGQIDLVSDANGAVSFTDGLAPYGTWEQTAEYGTVWIPAATDDPAWEPYSQGRWLWTDDYGWYFVSDDVVSPFGWIVFHYGRWVRSPQNRRWSWIPGREWAPTWVSWRRGDGLIGWQPLPPDPLVVSYQNALSGWIFVQTGNLMQADVYHYRVQQEVGAVHFHETAVEGRTEIRAGFSIGINLGVVPGVVAAATGLPLPAFKIRPQLFPGTVGLVEGQLVRQPPAWGPLAPRRESIQAPGGTQGLPPVSPGETPSDLPQPRWTAEKPSMVAPSPSDRSPIPPLPTERPVPQPPSEGNRPPGDRGAVHVQPRETMPQPVAPPQR